MEKVNQNTHAFYLACKCGRLDEAQRLYGQQLGSSEKSNVRANCFFLACQYGHLKVAQWLYSLPGSVDVHARDEYVFRFVCRSGYLEVAQWLYALPGSVNVHACDDVAFYWACGKGELEVAQWRNGCIVCQAVSMYMRTTTMHFTVRVDVDI